MFANALVIKLKHFRSFSLLWTNCNNLYEHTEVGHFNCYRTGGIQGGEEVSVQCSAFPGHSILDIFKFEVLDFRELCFHRIIVCREHLDCDSCILCITSQRLKLLPASSQLLKILRKVSSTEHIRRAV